MPKTKILSMLSDRDFTCAPPFAEETPNTLSIPLLQKNSSAEPSVEKYERARKRALKICEILFGGGSPNALVCETVTYEMLCGGASNGTEDDTEESGDEEELLSEMAQAAEEPFTAMMIKMQYSSEYALPFNGSKREYELGVIKRTHSGSMAMKKARTVYYVGKKECDPTSLITWQIAGLCPYSTGLVSYENECVISVTEADRCVIVFADESALQKGKQLLEAFLSPS